MTFHVYRTGRTFALQQGDTIDADFADEASAADVAVRIAQDRDALYTINYWRP